MEQTTIFVQQPWASLLCSKFIDAFDFGIDIGDYCRHVIVYALPSESKFPILKPTAEWLHVFHFAEVTGAVPFSENLPVNKYVGCIELGRCQNFKRSIWTYKGKSIHTTYRVFDAFLFDYPIDENRLQRALVMKNFHRPMHVSLSPNGALRVPLSKHHFGNIYVDSTFTVELTEELRNLLFLEHPSAAPRYVTFFYATREKTFIMEQDNNLFYPCDGAGNPIKSFSHIKNEWLTMPFYVFNLRTQI